MTINEFEYNEGRFAYQDGVAYDRNPNREGTFAWVDWANGWKDEKNGRNVLTCSTDLLS